MEHPRTTKNVGQPCVICGQPANAQATVEALQADNRTYIDERHKNMKQLEELRQQVEALQRERDQWKEAFERSCDDTAHLKAALDAEREKVTKLEVALDAAQDESTRWFRAARLQREAGRDLRALVRGLPVVNGEVVIESPWVGQVNGTYDMRVRQQVGNTMTSVRFAQFHIKEDAESYAALLKARASLDPAPVVEGEE